MTGQWARLRDELHARAYTFHARGNSEAAQTLWAVVESIDTILTDEQNGLTAMPADLVDPTLEPDNPDEVADDTDTPYDERPTLLRHEGDR